MPNPLVQLRRTVRFTSNLDGPAATGADRNGYAGIPTLRRLGSYYEFDVTCIGEVPADRSYLVDIKDVDAAARASISATLDDAWRARPQPDPRSILAAVIPALQASLGAALDRVRWRLTPFYSLEIRMDQPGIVQLRQRFDFAAAHRLHDPRLSDVENQQVFGKCNNPNGHGHNYQLEPCVEVAAGGGLTLPELERITKETILDRFDHKHLNEDTAEFDQRRGGVNPSVENIARVFFDLLRPVVDSRRPGVRLAHITVWETDRTCATFPAAR